ncbi:MAG: hypothetical protein HQM14_17715 [SAR324 cluster bacterium]|nr:hypothetical protein [SAR324 cluster bacterium]
MPTSIKNLAALDQTDRDLVVSEQTLKNLDKEIAVARMPLSACEESLKEKQAEYDELNLKEREAALKLSETEIFIEKLEAQVPLIRTQKEFVASKKQLEDARKRKGLLEEEIVNYMDSQTACQGQLEQLKEQLETEGKDFQHNIQNLLKEKDTTTSRLKALKKGHGELVAKLDSSLNQFYERSKERGIDPAICAVVNKACSGCNTVLQPQLVNEMIAKPNEHRNCPFCFRIIYYLPESE